MRFSERKINRVAKKVREALMSDPQLKRFGDDAAFEAEIKAVIMANLREEEEIEEQAKKLLEQYSNQIDVNGMDYHNLLRRSINQIARERKFIL